jgi:hypothetical protein
MVQSKISSVKRDSPCPVCGGTHKCSVATDGAIFCGRKSEAVPGFVHLGPCKSNPIWHIYRREGDPVLEERDRQYREQHNLNANGSPPIDWAAIAQLCEDALTTELRDELAADLGVPPGVLALLGVGWYAQDKCWTFPERDAAGQAVGINRRWKDGRKKVMPGGHRGVYIPSDWRKKRDGPILLPEGASNVLALRAMGLCAIGRPNNMAGADILGGLLKDTTPDREIIVLGDFDPKLSGDWPGLAGAKSTAAKLSQHLGRMVTWCLPPDSAKDVRKWFNGLGLDLNRPSMLAKAGERLLAHLSTHKSGKYDPPPKSDGLSDAVEIFTAEQLLGMELPEPRWAVRGIVPEGLTLFAGKPKLGKSWLALNLAIAIATGGTALGKIPVEQGDVLYLALEDTKRRLLDRIVQLQRSQGAARLNRLHFIRQCPRQDKGGLKVITDWLESHEQARLVIIDTWAKFRPSRRQRSDQYEEDYGHAAEVKAIADARGAAVLPLHHCRKMAAEDALEEVSGTLGLTGAADATLVLRRDRGQMDGSLFVTGRDVEEQDLALRWDQEFTLWSIMGEAEDYRISKDREAVIKVLQEAGRPVTASEAAPILQKTPNTTKQLLWQMAKSGLIEALGRGFYVTKANSANHTNHANDANHANRDEDGPVSGQDEENNRDDNPDAPHKTPWG